MSFAAGDLLILVVLVPAGILAVRSIWKKRKQGGCGCGCGGNCSGCRSYEEDDDLD